ncbi:MAG: hypothetical protein R3F38_18965 [Gammaproteobacteria bacterium]
MIKPEVVLAFLTFDDFGLLLVLGSAVTITLVVYTLAPKILKKPLLEAKFGQHLTVNTRDTVLRSAVRDRLGPERCSVPARPSPDWAPATGRYWCAWRAFLPVPA